MSKPRLAVIGVGHLGKEHARILAGFPDVELIGVVDQRPEQAESVALRCQTRAWSSYEPLLDQIDAAVIAVPTIYHHEVARDCLQHGISLLIEKPLAFNVEQANDLVALAEEQDLILQVGHIERFNPAFESLQQRPIQPKLINSQRLSCYTGRSTDIGVVLDLMIHDLDIVLNLVRSPIRSVSAMGASLRGGHEDVVQAHLVFENGCVANLMASRVHSTPSRVMELWAPEGFVQIDFHQRILKMVQPEPHVISSRAGINNSDGFQRYEQLCDHDGPDQLTLELREFVQSVRQHSLPRVTGQQGRNALVLAQHVLRSVQQHRWNGSQTGPTGPHELPAPLGPLFIPSSRSAA